MSTFTVGSVFNILSRYNRETNKVVYDRMATCKNPWTFEIKIDNITLPLSFITKNLVHGFETQALATNFRNNTVLKEFNLKNKVFILSKKCDILGVYKELYRLIYFNSKQFPSPEISHVLLNVEDIIIEYLMDNQGNLDGQVTWSDCEYQIQLHELME